MSISGSGCEVLFTDVERQDVKTIERSLIKTFRKDIWTNFIKGIKEFNLVEDGDKIAVAISGGKDSLMLAKLLQELKKHGKVNFELEFLSMDPGFNKANRELLEDHCKHLEIPVKIYESEIFRVVDEISNDYPCYMCARMRRGFLYAKAKELGCNKLALGHHFNDVIETIMLNLLYAGSYKTMMPKLKSTNFEGMELIRPLYYVREDDIKRFSTSNGLTPMNCGCIVAAKKTSSKRSEMKSLIASLKENFEDVEKSILSSSKNIHLDAVIGWKSKDERHTFLDEY